MNFVYVGNCPEVPDGETTFCPVCKKPIVERSIFSLLTIRVEGGKCGLCGARIPGVWSA